MKDIEQEKPYVLQGRLVGITKSKYNYMDERIFCRGSKEIEATNLEIMLQGGLKETVVFPMLIDYNTGINIMNQEINYTKTRTRHNNEEQGRYNVDKFILEILSGKDKGLKYEQET